MSTPDLIKAQTVKLGGKDYVQVAGRVLLAHADNDKIDIITEVISVTEQAVTMKATVTTRKGVFTGHAVSRANAKGVEGQSPLEVAETSAVGRALGYAGYAIDGGIASADEVQAAQAEQEQRQSRPAPQAPTPMARRQPTAPVPTTPAVPAPDTAWTDLAPDAAPGLSATAEQKTRIDELRRALHWTATGVVGYLRGHYGKETRDELTRDEADEMIDDLQGRVAESEGVGA